MMKLPEEFLKYIETQHLFKRTDRLLLAVSGGVDSMVLAAICHTARYDFAIAHCNFKLRGSESDADETFVKSIAKKYQVPFYVNHFDTELYAGEQKISIQVAARNLRYNWFRALAKEIQAASHAPGSNTYILTAHHADDNIETVLMNFFKGTGIKGLTGIQPKQGILIRPLLFAYKKQILDFAQTAGIAFREDSSNAKDNYTRNYFRNQLIPDIEKVYPQVRENILQTIQHVVSQNELYAAGVQLQFQNLLEEKDGEFHLPMLKFKKMPGRQALLYELALRFGFTSAQVPEIEKLMAADSGKYIVSPSHRILHNRNWFIISPLAKKEFLIYSLEEGEKLLDFPLGKLTVLHFDSSKTIQKSAHIAQMDARYIHFPLLIRKWKQADYFYPLGMQKKKKLSRFFIDQKLSLADKEKIWVVESNKKIIWVIGYRIDDRVKILPSTTNTVTLSLTPAAP